MTGDDVTSTLVQVRTYATDLERARKGRGGDVVPVVSTPIVAPAIKSDVTQSDTSLRPTTIPERPATLTPVSPTPISLPTKPVTLTASSDRDASYAATIITDNKTGRFHLGSEIVQSINGWWQDTLHEHDKKKVPKYTVPPAEHRQGVIERASTTTGRAATHDHHELVARLRAEKAGGIATTPPITTVLPAAALARGVVTTPNIPVLEPEIATPIASTPPPSVTPPSIPSAPIRPISPIIPPNLPTGDLPTLTTPEPVAVVGSQPPVRRILPIIPDHKEQPETSTEIVPKTPPYKPTIVPVIPSPAQNETSSVVFPRIEPMLPVGAQGQQETTLAERETILPTIPLTTRPGATFADVPLAMPKAGDTTKASIAARKEALTFKAQNEPVTRSSSWRIVFDQPIIILAGLVVLTIGVVSYIFLGASPTTTPIVTNPPSTGTNNLPPTSGNPITLPASGLGMVVMTGDRKLDLFTAIGEAKTDVPGVTFVVPVHGETGLPVESTELLTLMNRRLVADFLATVTLVQVGHVDGEPLIIIRTSSDTAARGGMFAWERTLSSDLSPWFGAPVRTLGLPDFTDGTTGTTDLRTLLDDDKERITYGIIRDAIIITTNREAFETVASIYGPAW